MKIKKSISQSASLNLRVLVALVVTLAGASLAFFAAASPPTSSGLRHSELPNTFAAAPLGGPPVVVSITPIRGPERAFQPSATIADLDHGFAAGATRYLHDDGLIYNDKPPSSKRHTTSTDCAAPTSRIRSPPTRARSLAACYSWTREYPELGSGSATPDSNTCSYHRIREAAVQSLYRTTDDSWRAPWAGGSVLRRVARPCGWTGCCRHCQPARLGRKLEAYLNQTGRPTRTR